MGELTARVINGINSSKEFEDFAGWIWMAGDLIRRASSPGFHSGFEDVDRENVSNEERNALQKALLSALDRNSDPLYVCSILSALRGTFDRDLLPLWIEQLIKYLGQLKQSNAIVFTILLALKDLDEHVFAEAQSLCVIDVERNVKEAERYLRRQDIVVPG